MELSMRSASLVPQAYTYDVTVYLVLNDFGELGRAYVETDETETDAGIVVANIMSGAYSNPLRVVAFNTAEGWSRDVTEDIARAVLERSESDGYASKSAREFVGRVLGQDVSVR